MLGLDYYNNNKILVIKMMKIKSLFWCRNTAVESDFMSVRKIFSFFAERFGLEITAEEKPTQSPCQTRAHC